MEHGLELIIPRLEIFGNWIFNIFSYPGIFFYISPILDILEIEASNILYNPGNIGNRRLQHRL